MQDWEKRNEEAKRKAEEQRKVLGAEIAELAKACTPEDLDKRFFKDFGCINFRDDEFFHELGLARRWHAMQQAAHPGQHELKQYDKWRCYHVTECKCGFSEACDSSD